jgi:signal transduction histidine kinase
LQQETQQLCQNVNLLPIEHRLLEATAHAAKTLLTIAPLDQAVNTALQILGEVLDTNRINIIENFRSSSGSTFPGWKALEYEWTSPGTALQFTKQEAAQGSYEEIPEIFEQLHRGQTMSYFTEEMPEPFRSEQIAIEVKATHLVPIFVRDQWWGVLRLDDCREAKQRNTAELSVLKIGADCVGSAIQQERTQQALLQTEQERTRSAVKHLQDLERLNSELQQALAHEVELRYHLSESEERYRALFELSSEGIYRWKLDQPIYVVLPVDEQVERTRHSLYVAEVNATYAAIYGLFTIEAASGSRLSDAHVSTFEKDLKFLRRWVENGYRIRAAESEEVTPQGKRCYFFNNVIGIIKDEQFIEVWGTQLNVTELRETRQALLEAERKRVSELTKANEELQQREREVQRSYRLLSVVAQVTKDLLEAENIDIAIPAALQAVGEVADMSRVILILEHQDPSTHKFKHCVEYEWVAAEIFDHLAVGMMVMDNDDFLPLVQSLHSRKSVWHLINDLPDVTRVQFERLSIKSTGVIPIFIEGRYFGYVGFDDCVAHRQWSQQEIDVLTAAAESIGAALHRKQLVDHLVEKRTRAAQERAAELVKANEALKQTVDVLATETDLNRFLGHVLQVIANQLDAPLTEYWYHPKPSNLAYVGLTYWQEQILNPEEQPGHVGLYGYPVPPEMVHQESLHHRRAHFITEDMATSAIHQQVAREYGLDAAAWYGTRGVSRLLNVPLILGDTTIGALIVFFPHHRHFTEQQIELTYALAQQVTLAIQLTQLAEEAKQAAIAREQEKAAQERAAELAKANEALRRSVERLAASGTLNSVLDSFLLESVAVTDAAAGAILQRAEGHEFIMRALVEHKVTIYPFVSHAPDDVYRQRTAADTSGIMRRTAEGETFMFSVEGIEIWFPEAAAYHNERGHKVIWHFPFRVGGEVAGYLGLAFKEERSLSTVQQETVQALAYQASLALETLRLAEEAKQAAIAREQEKAAQERAAELAKANEALKQSLTLLAQEPVLDKVLDYVLQTTVNQLGDRSGAIYLYSKPAHLSLMHLNYEDGQLQQGDAITHPAATRSRPPQAWDKQYLPLLRQNQILIHHASEFDSPAYAPYRQHNRDRGIQTLLIVPMLLGDQLLGSMTLRSTQHRNYTPEELELARALAQQATLAVQLTQLAEQRRQTAVLEERNRMARDIHDTLAQSFTGIVLQLEATKRLLKGGCSDTQASLDCIGDLARLGLAEARRSVRALRLEALETTDFSTALHQILHHMTKGTSTRATLAVEGVVRRLSPDAEENLLRIAQEALTNAIRHGHASTIAVQLLFEPKIIHLQISDDGDGFDSQHISFSGFGLLGMQERVEQLNGQFHLISQPGQGTTITVSVSL